MNQLLKCAIIRARLFTNFSILILVLGSFTSLTKADEPEGDKSATNPFPLPPTIKTERWTGDHPEDGYSVLGQLSSQLNGSDLSVRSKPNKNNDVQLSHPVIRTQLAPQRSIGTGIDTPKPRMEDMPALGMKTVLPASVPLPEPNKETIQPGASLPSAARFSPTQQPISIAQERQFSQTIEHPATGRFGFAPNIIGDFYNDTKSFSGSVLYGTTHVLPGTIVSGSGGSATSTIAFDILSNGSNDVFTTGVGADYSGDGNIDGFNIAPPSVGSDALVLGGPFVHIGGRARLGALAPIDGVYADGDPWAIRLFNSAVLNGPNATITAFSGPALASRRTKVSHNFSPDVRNRFYLNFDAIGDVGGAFGDVQRGTIGVERAFGNRISVEARVPLSSRLGSEQKTDTTGEDRDFELGNIALIAKGVLRRQHNLIWTAGLGTDLPTAQDARLTAGGQDRLVVENGTYHLLPFTNLLVLLNNKTAIQGHLQFDFALGGDSVSENFLGLNPSVSELGEFQDSSLIHASLAFSRTLNRNPRSALRQAILNAELHYSSTLESSEVIVRSYGYLGSFSYSNPATDVSALNTTVGLHLMMGDRLVMTPALAIPLTTGDDQVFDYQAMLQLNYLR